MNSIKGLLANIGNMGEKPKKAESDYMAVYCQDCGFIDYNVSKTGIRCIQQLTQSDDAIIDCKQCGAHIKVNLKEDLLKIGKTGNVKLKDKTQW